MELDFRLARKTIVSEYRGRAWQWRYTMPDGSAYFIEMLPGPEFPFRAIYRLDERGQVVEVCR